MLLIVDGSALAHTAFYASVPKGFYTAKTEAEQEFYYQYLQKASNGTYTGAVEIFMDYLMKLIDDKNLNVEQVAIVFDKSRLSTFRAELYPAYKGQRPPKPEPLKKQIDYIKHLLRTTGFCVSEAAKYEADDLAGMLSNHYCKETEVCILTKDKDYLQLVKDNVHVLMLRTSSDVRRLCEEYGADKKVLSNVYDYTRNVVVGELGVEPCQVADLKAVSGDSSDNIPGVIGVSDKTIIPLLRAYGSLEAVYNALDGANEDGTIEQLKKDWAYRFNVKPSYVQILFEGKQQAKFCLKLTRIVTDYNTNVPLDRLSVAHIDYTHLAAVLDSIDLAELCEKVKKNHC